MGLCNIKTRLSNYKLIMELLLKSTNIYERNREAHLIVYVVMSQTTTGARNPNSGYGAQYHKGGK